MVKILVTNGRSPITLDFVRNLAGSGNEVYVAETEYFNFCRFSNAVKQSFLVPPLKPHPLAYIEAIVKIIVTQGIDFFIPTWEDSLLISKYKGIFPSTCTVFVAPFETLYTLHSKWFFIKYLAELGFDHPETRLLSSRKDLEKVDLADYALKASSSRGSSNVFRVKRGEALPQITPTKEIPWVAQEWIEGNIFCTYSICREGKVKAHAVYPMDFVKKKGGSYSLSYHSIRHPKILKWTKDFAAKSGYEGQLAFDFVETKDGVLYPIECNPRITSGATLFTPKDRLDRAIFGTSKTLITPQEDYKRQMLLPMLFYGWKTAFALGELKFFFHKLFASKDIIFHSKDLKPFLMQPLLYCKFLKDAYKYKKQLPAAFTHTIDYDL